LPHAQIHRVKVSHPLDTSTGHFTDRGPSQPTTQVATEETKNKHHYQKCTSKPTVTTTQNKHKK